ALDRPGHQASDRNLRSRIRGRVLGSQGMTHSNLTRRMLGLAAGAALAVSPAACGQGDKPAAAKGAPSEISFAILPAEGQASSGPLWQPLLDDMTKAVGVPVKPYFASNYPVLVE